MIDNMTRSTTHRDIVSLSVNNWLALIAIIVSALLFIVSGYLRHDRLLTEVIVQQQAQAERMERLERTLDGGGL